MSKFIPSCIKSVFKTKTWLPIDGFCIQVKRTGTSFLVKRYLNYPLWPNILHNNHFSYAFMHTQGKIMLLSESIIFLKNNWYLFLLIKTPLLPFWYLQNSIRIFFEYMKFSLVDNVPVNMVIISKHTNKGLLLL